MRMRHVFAVLAAMAAVAALSFTAAGPASADAQCPQNTVCFWTGPNFTGEMSTYENPVSHECGRTPAQPARSIYNNDSDQEWTFYQDPYCSAFATTLAPGEREPFTHVYSWQ
jgi:hypothetical protein